MQDLVNVSVKNESFQLHLIILWLTDESSFINLLKKICKQTLIFASGVSQILVTKNLK